MKKCSVLITLFLITWSINAQTIVEMSKEGGVYTVPCKVNGLPLKFIFDTGASDVSISLTEAIFMLKNGYECHITTPGKVRSNNSMMSSARKCFWDSRYCGALT